MHYSNGNKKGKNMMKKYLLAFSVLILFRSSLIAENAEVIKILIAYTTDAKTMAASSGSYMNSIEVAINNKLLKCNDILKNSGVEFQYSFVHLQEVSYVGQLNLGALADRDKLKSGEDGLGNIHMLRNQHEADIVFLIVSRYLSGPVGASYLHALEGENGLKLDHSFSEFAFAVSDLRNFYLDNTFMHEIGHLMGLFHDRTTVAQNEQLCTGFSSLDECLDAKGRVSPYAHGYYDEDDNE
ncbi:MAG: hypothetical protein GF350_17220, partial [Chitinivibrionales bacterium]|nr:hypothetical protein [Chitinivibrionales bacterium]